MEWWYVTVNFAGFGVWQWKNNAPWTQVHTSNDGTATSMAAADDDPDVPGPASGRGRTTTFEQLQSWMRIDGGRHRRKCRADVVMSFPGFASGCG